MTRHAKDLALFAGVVLALALLAALLLPPAASSTTPTQHPATVQLAPAATDNGARILMGHLLGKKADYDPAWAATMTEVAHRICDGDLTAADWIASFTAPHLSPTTGWTEAEARAFIAAAHATFCTWRQ